MLGDVPDDFLADGLQLALGVPGLDKGGRILLLGHLRLLQLDLDV
jgi:hypothetical protein